MSPRLYPLLIAIAGASTAPAAAMPLPLAANDGGIAAAPASCRLGARAPGMLCSYDWRPPPPRPPRRGPPPVPRFFGSFPQPYYFPPPDNNDFGA